MFDSSIGDPTLVPPSAAVLLEDDDTGLEGTNRHVVGKGKASERRVTSAASSTNRRNEINETDESQQEVSNRNSVGSTSGSSGSGGGKLSRLLKKAAGGLN